MTNQLKLALQAIDDLRLMNAMQKDEIERLREELVQSRKTASYWKENLNLANDEIERLREEIKHIMEDYTIKRKV